MFSIDFCSHFNSRETVVVVLHLNSSLYSVSLSSSCSCDRFISVTFSSLYPALGKRSHLINPKGETCRCTTVSLNPPPPFLSLPPISPRSLLLGLYKQPCARCHPSPSKHKGGFYQYVLVTFRGQCCCSWTLSAGPQKSRSVSEGHYVCLLCSEECQVLGQMWMRVLMFMWSALTWAGYREHYL